MSKKYCIFISALFCAFIGLFLVANAATPSREFSEMENRNLEQMPKLSVDSLLSGQFMKDFETYTTDQFVGRDLWIALKSSSERILGKHENNDVYFCDQDTLITRFDQPDAAKVSENVNYVNSFVENVDIPVTFSLIPTQACIWADRLPNGAPMPARPTCWTRPRRLYPAPPGRICTAPCGSTRMRASSTALTTTGPAWAHTTATPAWQMPWATLPCPWMPTPRPSAPLSSTARYSPPPACAG